MKVGDLVECIEPDVLKGLHLGDRHRVRRVFSGYVDVGVYPDSWRKGRFKVVEEAVVRKKLSEMEPGGRFIGRTGEKRYRFVGKCNGGWAVQSPIGSVYVWGGGDEEYEMVPPAPKARPFASGEEFAPHRGRWLKWKDDGSCLFRVLSYHDTVVWLATGHGTAKRWDEAFQEVVFEDGSPFGVVDSVYNGGE